MSELRAELPPLPPQLRHLPVVRGYPVPWFVMWFDNDVPVVVGEGSPDFRVMDSEKLRAAVVDKRCWVCGGRLGRHLSFVLGPMCAVNRNTAEPPCHLDCADWSARACPFLSRPQMRRNEKQFADGESRAAEDMPGVANLRNPGVALVWTTLGYRTVQVENGVLFKVGSPEHVRWYCEGRPATREEVQHSIDTGMPSLRELAEAQGGLALAALSGALQQAESLLPA